VGEGLEDCVISSSDYLKSGILELLGMDLKYFGEVLTETEMKMVK
jgi:hypothetical protein